MCVTYARIHADLHRRMVRRHLGRVQRMRRATGPPSSVRRRLCGCIRLRRAFGFDNLGKRWQVLRGRREDDAHVAAGVSRGRPAA